MRAPTMAEVAATLRESLIEYIEATYHISDAAILKQRRDLLEEVGVVHQSPFLESTPRYKTGRKFSQIKNLPQAARQVFEMLAVPNERDQRLLYDPPYTHQSKAVDDALIGGRNLLIMTGTGSGKTESFLMPVLGKLAIEAEGRPAQFGKTSAMRALVLYPMNALVNDQLGRLRAMFGDPRVVKQFMKWAGRPPRFARYTSRTPYAGVRLKRKDQSRLKAFGDFYVDALETGAEQGPSGDAARQLVEDLKAHGKWPAKPDLARWYYGPRGRYWQDKEGNFIRAVTLEEDSELLTRHEAQRHAPDLLVTNYSMLEYMMMRPVERTIFDQTKLWLAQNPDEKFLLVLDEAHLYRGAGGTEVGLLLRRLRDRLDIPPERFQVICASASFSDKRGAQKFAAELTGAPFDHFSVVEGDHKERSHPGVGLPDDAALLAGLDMLVGFRSEDEAERTAAVAPFLSKRAVIKAADESLEAALFRALNDYAPLALLVNTTMGRAQPVGSLGALIFPGVGEAISDQAVTNLAALASTAREKPDDASLLPCRVHTFFRGLRGLWACLDPQCSALPVAERSGVIGKLFTQPRDLCDCNGRVLELFTCRVCGSPYARGYCDDPAAPSGVWSEAGVDFVVDDQRIEELVALDLLLVEPGKQELGQRASLDLINGLLNSPTPGAREREVFLPPDRTTRVVDDEEDDEGQYLAEAGKFHKCAVCERKALQSRSPVQDHETKGDQPFQVLVNRQLQVQPPGPQKETRFAPLRGRKVLAFSDSRQVAARLAPYLQMYSVRDSLRPLMVRGWNWLEKIPNFALRIDDIYTAVLIAANELDVRLRPELALQETFNDYTLVGERVKQGILDEPGELKDLVQEIRAGDAPPEALLADIMSTMRDRSLGLEALAFASIAERADRTKDLAALPDIPGVTENADDRIELGRAWLREWGRAGFWLPKMRQRWYLQHPDRKVRVTSVSGKFQKFERRLPTPAARKVFKEKWVPRLLAVFAQAMDGKYRLEGQYLSLKFGGAWVRCADCKSVHRPVRLLPVCLDCGHAAVHPLDPDQDEVFSKRKGFYRRGVAEAMADPPVAPMSVVAAEHTAQLNTADHEDVFSKAEENELLFQDVALPDRGRKTPPTAIDVLSSTTTMEVGIDIGQLPAVALRNMPPSRANYQQRAGRAGRRGNSIATVVAFGGSDTHDEHFFSKPVEMISGRVIDPTLCLDNAEIAHRHVRAFLLQCYHQARITAIPEGTGGNLFSVLGNVSEFLVPENVLSRADFEAWLKENEKELQARVTSWLPGELSPADRDRLITNMIKDCLDEIDKAIGGIDAAVGVVVEEDVSDEEQYVEVPAEPDEEKPASRPSDKSLLDTLLYKGVLPRYAFPTDVATFHVFDGENSTEFRPKFRFQPSQGLAVALSQYSPERQVWISGMCYSSGAIYSPMRGERSKQWRDRRLHLECSRCGYGFTIDVNQGIEVNQTINCDACGDHTVGPARYWMRPTGFAHPVDVSPVTSPDDLPETTYATRAKLTLRPQEHANWQTSSERVRYLTARTHLLVSNTGPARDGYAYCVKCGRIESAANHTARLVAPHPKPYPDPAEPTCPGNGMSPHVVLGTDFPTDVALFSLRLHDPIRLPPTSSITRIALRTLSEALARAATDLLEVEAGEVLAEYRPAISDLGVQGLETELFLYDSLSGGAGFAMEAARKGRRLFERAYELMDGCEEMCPMSCYRCLRSFRNRVDHGYLDRHVGMALVRYLLTGDSTAFTALRLRTANQILLADLKRHEDANRSFTNEAAVVDADGLEHAQAVGVRHGQELRALLVVTNPLVQTNAGQTVSYGGVDDVLLIKVNELVVRKNLAQATISLLAATARA